MNPAPKERDSSNRLSAQQEVTTERLYGCIARRPPLANHPGQYDSRRSADRAGRASWTRSRQMSSKRYRANPTISGRYVRVSAWHFPVAPLFEHAREFRFLYDAFTRSPKLDRMLKIRQITLAESFQQRMTEAGLPSDVPIPLLAQHHAATLMNLLSWWMDHHCPCSTQDMERYFHRLVNGPATPGSRV